MQLLQSCARLFPAEPGDPASQGGNLKNTPALSAGGTLLREGRRNTDCIFKSNLKNLFVASVCRLMAENT